MVKLLAKYLKPFWLSVVFAVLLLFGQAFSDLSLPHYMSDIVNVGIQQGGISESTPKAISAKALSFLKVFMTDEEKEVINKSYTLRSVNDQGQEHDRYVKEYRQRYYVSIGSYIWFGNMDIHLYHAIYVKQ